MTSSNIKNVPRESLPHLMVGWFTHFAKARWTKPQPGAKTKRARLPNIHMVELSPYLLRDIGFRDTQVQRRRK